jgi:aminoglycoside phosphotransferase (APT) family kinase protein
MTRPAPMAAAWTPGSSTEAPARRTPLWELVESSGLQSLVMGTSKDPNAKVTVLLVSPASCRPVLAAKAPTTDVAARAVEAEAAILSDLRGFRAPVLLETIPRLVEVAEFEGRPAVVMTALPGTPMTTSYLRWRHTASRARVTADFSAVGAWLATLQSETASAPATIDMDGGVAERLRARFAGDEQLGTDLDRLAAIYAALRREAVPRTVVHGDLWVGNVLLTGGRVSGVVDWEAGVASGEPLRDLARFPLMYALYLDRRTRAGRRVTGHKGLRATSWGAGVEYALYGRGWFPDLFRGFLRDGLARLGASPARWRDAAMAGLAEAAALSDDQEFARLQLELFRRVAHGASRRKESR